jgi:drug/metabolite transporter (DMT)-like permease
MLIIYLLTIAAIFGFNPIVQKYILNYISTESLMFLSAIAYASIMGIYTLFYHTKPFESDVRTLFKHPFLAALIPFGVFLVLILGNFMYLSIIQNHKTYLITAITASYPLFTVLGGYLLFHELLTLTDLVGILMIMGGVTVLAI